MAKKPSYEKLERKVKELEKQSVERKRAEEELEAQKNKFHTILDSVASGIDIVSYDYKVQFQNKLLVDRFGDLRGKLCYKQYMNRAKPCSDCPMRTAIDNNRVERTELIAADGRNYELISTPIKNPDGTISAVEVGMDITERKQVEESLRKSENKYRTLLEHLPQKIFHKDRNSVYLSCNENLARDLKIKAEEIKGKTDHELVPKKLAKKYRADDKRIMGSGKTEDIEEKYMQDGQEIWIHTVKTPIKDEKGNITGILGIFWDITPRKGTEKALREREAALEARTRELEEVNSALTVLLKRRDEDKTEVEEKVLFNVKELVVPYAEKLKKIFLDKEQLAYLNVLESNLNNIISPFAYKLSSKYLRLTPKEIHIANLVKDGRTSKEIAELFNVSVRTIESHRKSIRAKIGLKNSKANLRSRLLSM